MRSSVFIIVAAALLLSLPVALIATKEQFSDHEIRSEALALSRAFSAMRAYYTAEVVAEIQQSEGEQISLSQFNDPGSGALPIPATMSIELAELLSTDYTDDEGYRFSFVSDHPFSARADRILTPLQRTALNHFRKNPEAQLYEGHDDSLFLHRVAIATPVVMGPHCVECHNAHPDTPASTWKVGDIRGIQVVEVVRPFVYSYGPLTPILLFITAFGVAVIFLIRYLNRNNRALKRSHHELSALRDSAERLTEDLRLKVEDYALLAAVVDESVLGVAISDARRPRYPLIFVNAAFCRITGYAENEVLGRNCSFLQGPGTSVKAQQELRQALANDRPVSIDILNYRKSGRAFWNRLSIFPMRDKAGEVTQHVAYLSDVTDIKENENVRYELDESRHNAQRIESLGIMIAGVAHEVNTPLGVALTASSHIVKSATMVRQALSDGTLERVMLEEHLADEIEAGELTQANLKRASDLMRSFKQIAADRSAGSWHTIELRGFLESVLRTLRPSIRRSGVTLELSCAEAIEMNTEPGALSQIVVNVVMNALNHAFVGRDSGYIVISGIDCGDKVELSIADDGVGITEEDQAQIFTPFFTTKRGMGGTGLGLYITHQIATQTFAGTIEVLSEPGAGTTFRFRFPKGGVHVR
jgi:PAS domain S-box-containing protein